MNSFIISMGVDMRGLIFTANYGQIVIILNKKTNTNVGFNDNFIPTISSFSSQ